MSGYYNRNNRGITKKLGPVTAYADAVLAGYKGTREQWAQDMAKLGQNVTQVAQNTKLTTELAAQTRENKEQVAKDTADVRRLADETSDNAVQVASNTAESNRLAKETKQAAAQAKADAEYAGAAADNFRVDTTLSEEGKAAEAKTVGEKFAQLSEDISDETKNRQNAIAQETVARNAAIAQETVARNAAIAQERSRAVARENEIEELFSLPTQEAVSKWLDEHPEATTTVQDASLDVEKFTDDAKKHVVKDYVTPQMFGAKGDGVADDTQALKACFEYCTKNGLLMYIPNGTYILNEQLKLADYITDDAANKPIYIMGQSALGVRINTTNDTKPVIDVSRSKIVHISNLASDNSWFHCLQYGDDFAPFSRLRDVQLFNVYSLDREHSYPSWNIMINTPAPKDYGAEEQDSFYNRYPIEIVNNSGYNPIMINNFANTNEDGTSANPTDNSSIGIIDRVSNASGAILIDIATRSAFQVQCSGNVPKSGVKNNVVYEVASNGNIAIGCSCLNGDPVASGIGVIKARASYPSIKMYDENRSNRMTEIVSSDDSSYFMSRDEKGDAKSGLKCNYKTSVVTPIGNFVQGETLVLNDENFVRVPSVTGKGVVKIDITSSNWIDGLLNGVTGKEVVIFSTNSNCYLKNDVYNYSFKTKNGENLQLKKGMCAKFIYLDDGWYEV